MPQRGARWSETAVTRQPEILNRPRRDRCAARLTAVNFRPQFRLLRNAATERFLTAAGTPRASRREHLWLTRSIRAAPRFWWESPTERAGGSTLGNLPALTPAVRNIPYLPGIARPSAALVTTRMYVFSCRRGVNRPIETEIVLGVVICRHHRSAP
jgi:hypothetical protein